jgi:hypothetical protein
MALRDRAAAGVRAALVQPVIEKPRISTFDVLPVAPGRRQNLSPRTLTTSAASASDVEENGPSLGRLGPSQYLESP